MQRTVNLNRSPLGKLLALRSRAKARPAKATVLARPARSNAPPLPMAEQLSRSPEIRITSLV